MTDVVMPQMGESIVEGTLTKWLKKPGDAVERDEPLFEISTDKVDTEIPSPAAGTLAEVLVEEGKTVGINTVVARIDEEWRRGRCQRARRSSRPPPPRRLPAPGATERGPRRAACTRAEEPAPAAEPAGPLSPLVRKMAREHNLDLAGQGHRRRRPHHQAGCGSLPGAAAPLHRRGPARPPALPVRAAAPPLAATAARPRRWRPPVRPRPASSP